MRLREGMEEILSGGAQTTKERRSLEGRLGNFKDIYWMPQDSVSDTMLNNFDTM
jgi:hypothetical protein